MREDGTATEPVKRGDVDSELNAMSAAYEALTVLTPAAQCRAFQWLGSRLAAEGMHTRPPYC